MDLGSLVFFHGFLRIEIICALRSLLDGKRNVYIMELVIIVCLDYPPTMSGSNLAPE